MKRRFLPLSLFLIFTMLGGFLISTSSMIKSNKYVPRTYPKDALSKGNKPSAEYLRLLRNNQNTGLISPKDLSRAQRQLLEMDNARLAGINWKELGPDNFGGRTRAIVFDNKDESAKTAYAAAVTGGIWKSTDIGVTWFKINQANSNLNVSCMIQLPNGDIYAGTGESFSANTHSGLEQMGYTGGFMGNGIYKSTDGDNFTLLNSTNPDFNDSDSDWAFVNELAYSSSNNRLYSATNAGLKYSDDGGSSWTTAKDSEGNELVENSTDVQAGNNGLVIASINNKTYVSYNDDPNDFILRSFDDSTGMIPIADVKRIEFAIAPSDENIVYASVVNKFEEIYNVYRSANKGVIWDIVMPGSQSMTILGGQGVYNNVIRVFPDNPNKLLLGGINLWEGVMIQEEGFFAWTNISQGFFNAGYSDYLHVDQHVYTFRPGYNNQFLVGTDGGVYIGEYSQGFYNYQTGNRNYNTTQFYSIGYSGIQNYVIGGAQDNGSILITGTGNTTQQGKEIMGGALAFQNGGDGGSAVISLINKNILVASTTYGDVRRSDDAGENYSANAQFLNGIGNVNSFKTPVALWESFDNPNSRDSIMYHSKDTIVAGAEVMANSANSSQPFYFTATNDLLPGDSVFIVDPVSSRFFLATAINIYMMNSLHDFGKTPEWWKIANKDNTVFTGTPQCLGLSTDANYLFVGTQSGELFRISNLALAYNFDRADVTSPTCIVSVEKLPVYIPGTTEEITQIITSIAVDPQNSNKILLTFGNYGNEQYVMFSDNALSQVPEFKSKQGNLPLMPVYSSVIEMKDGNIAIIGTEHGIFSTTNINAASPVWETDDEMMGSVPVFELKQQLVGQKKITVPTDDDDIVFDGATNKGNIYAATYGRGLFYTTNFWQPTTSINEIFESNNSYLKLNIYPNPATQNVSIEVNGKSNTTALVLIYDLSGKLMLSENIIIKQGLNTLNFNVSSYAIGTYIISAQVEGKTYSNKLMVN